MNPLATLAVPASMSAPRSIPGRTWRRGAMLVLMVLLGHLWLADQTLHDQLGAGAANSSPRRIEVSFVRELKQQQPATLAPPLAAQRAPRAALAPAPAASAPLPEVLPVPELAQLLPPARSTEVATAVAEAAPTAAAPAVPAASEAAAATTANVPAFEWPPSTRLSYQLTGYYRGAVEGQAQVEWLRNAGRYQVHLDVSLGPSFAPLMSRRMSSDGELTATGLRPRRYDELTRVAMRAPRTATIYFDDERVRLPAGTELALPVACKTPPASSCR